MEKDNLYLGEEAQTKLFAGFFKVSDAVSGTLGCAGYNATLEHVLNPHTFTTNDGVTIAKAIKLVDPVENMGAQLAKEISSKSDKEGGDGTTTSLVLSAAILREALPHLKELSPMELKRQLDECLPIIEKSIDDQKKNITPSEVKAVATISAESEEIGSLIQEIYEHIGKDGILYPDLSNTFETHYTLGKGIQIKDAGLVSPYLADFNANGQQLNYAHIKDAYVLITKQKITSGSDLSAFFQKIYRRNDSVKELVVFCDEIEALAIGHIISLKVRDKEPMKVVIVKMPTLWKDWWYEDLAKMTGATIIDPVAGLTYKNASYEHLGHIDSVTVDAKNTYLDGTQDITDYLKELEDKADDESKIRMVRLNTKTARLFVGAKSETELAYKSAKVQDARNAAFLAMKDGIVPGGGVTLRNAANIMPTTIGGKIMGIALRAPIKQIITNAGAKDIYSDNSEPQTKGFNAKNGEFVDMFEAGIVDPAGVTLSSVRNALSVASTLLTSRVVITLPPQEKEPQQPQLMMPQ